MSFQSSDSDSSILSLFETLSPPRRGNNLSSNPRQPRASPIPRLIAAKVIHPNHLDRTTPRRRSSRKGSRSHKSSISSSASARITMGANESTSSANPAQASSNLEAPSRKRSRPLDTTDQGKSRKLVETFKKSKKSKSGIAKVPSSQAATSAIPPGERDRLHSIFFKTENKSPDPGYRTASAQTQPWQSSDDSSDVVEEDGFRRRRHGEDDDEAYRDYGSPDDDFEIEAQFDKEHARTEAGHERRNLIYELTQEKARRMAQAIQVPEDAKMGDGEKSLYLELALRGCKPVMFHHWKTDFSTLPESLFSSAEEPLTDSDELIFKTKTRSEFHAIKAMKDLLDLGGQVRDCNFLTVYPPDVIRKAISKYIRWAIDDAGLRNNSETLPFHIVYVQKLEETTLDTVTKLVKKLTKLAVQHKVTYGDIKNENAYWPTLVGYVICGPIATILSLDSDPGSLAWSGPPDSRVKYMGQFDFTEPDQDVWNSLALAISMIHVRETMLQLASVYSGPRAPLFRGQDDELSDDH